MALIALSLTASLLLTGCNGSDSASPEPTSSRGSSEPPGSAAPSVVPADGPLLDGDVSSVHAPQGWKVRDNGMPWSKNASDPSAEGNQSMLLLESPWGAPSPLDQMARFKFDAFDAKPRRLPDVTLDGERAYHLAGRSGHVPVDLVGLTSHDRWVDVTIRSGGLDAAARADLVRTIVASFRWKD